MSAICSQTQGSSHYGASLESSADAVIWLQDCSRPSKPWRPIFLVASTCSVSLLGLWHHISQQHTSEASQQLLNAASTTRPGTMARPTPSAVSRDGWTSKRTSVSSRDALQQRHAVGPYASHLHPQTSQSKQLAPEWPFVASVIAIPMLLAAVLFRQWRTSSKQGLVDESSSLMSMAAWAGLKGRGYAGAGRHPTQLNAEIDPNLLPDPSVADAVMHHLHNGPFATGYGIPCQVQKCGDEIYSATLDPVRRLEAMGPAYEKIIPPLALFGTYLFAKPGVAYGILDNLILAPLHRSKLPKLNPKKIKVGKKLGAGGFGEVYLASYMNQRTGNEETIVIKRAKEFGEAETWMNERINRARPGVCAQLLDSFEIKPTKGQKTSTVFGNTGKKELWLAFKYEGGRTLNDYLQDSQFPFNMEVPLFGEPLDGPKNVERKLLTVRELLREMVKATAAIHSIGIVHRDLKPQNTIVADDGSLKIIDLGCAADLRSGINYIPQEYVMDPRYSAPEMTVMDASTPTPPPIAVATFFAPALWLLNTPDRFDVYSLGIAFLQMCFPALRADAAIAQFNKRFATEFKYDLEAWRASEMKRNRKDFMEGFELLDMDDGAGWDLLKKMLQFKSRDRPSTEQILQSSFIKGPLITLADRLRIPLEKILEVASDAADKYGISRYVIRNPVLTEAQMDDMLSDKPNITTPGGYRTMAWWESRKRALTVVTRRAPKPRMVDQVSERLQDALFKDRKF